MIHSSLGAFLAWAALSGGVHEAPIYDDYKQAYVAARAAQRPILVILNPANDADGGAVDVEALCRSTHRRELLGHYVVAVIDASTPEGRKVHKLFDSPPLPRVSVIDKQQKWQIYRTSRSLNAEDWNLLLKAHKKGSPPVIQAARGQCLT